MEGEHAPVVTAVAFGEHRDCVIVLEAVFDDFAHVQVLARVLVHGNATDVVEHPAKNGNLPQVSFRDECRDGDGWPDDIDVEKTLVICDDHELLVVGNVFLTFDFEFDSENFEKGFEEGNANLRAFLPASQDFALEEHERKAQDAHSGED